MVDSTDQHDTGVKNENTAGKTEGTAVAVDDVDVNGIAAAARTYLQSDAHTVSVFGMNYP